MPFNKFGDPLQVSQCCQCEHFSDRGEILVPSNGLALFKNSFENTINQQINWLHFSPTLCPEIFAVLSLKFETNKKPY